MTDMVELGKARERMNLRRTLWFRCMNKATLLLDTPGAPIDKYDKALQVIAQAYSVSCDEVRALDIDHYT